MTGSLGSAVITIEAIGPVAWVIAIGAIGVAVAGAMTTVGSGGVAVAEGGVGTLTTLRKYKAKREGGKVVLTRR